MAPRLDVVGLIVHDMAASLAFYRRLGFDIAEGAESEGHVEASVGGLRVAWDTVDVIKSFDPSWTEPSGNRMTLAFACDDPAEVDAVYRELTEAGYDSHLAPFDAFWGQRYATVSDPDGNHVDLFASLPKSD
jgi:uncharacterized glyoxalase superfamily protein PhnB